MAKKKETNSDIQIFCYKAMPVRTTEINGETWFVAKDICDILEIVNPSDATQVLDDDEKGIANIYTPGGMQSMTVIDESGLYNLIFRSRKNEAKQFRKWVTHDVLPSIRKTGSYSTPNAQKKPEKKSHMSSGWFKTVSRIIDLAFSAKTDADFQKVLALDMAFSRETSYSALNAAGLYIDIARESSAEYHKQDWDCYCWEYHYKLRLDKSLVLPSPYTVEKFEGSDPQVFD